MFNCKVTKITDSITQKHIMQWAQTSRFGKMPVGSFNTALTITLAFLLVYIHNTMNPYLFLHDSPFLVVVD